MKPCWYPRWVALSLSIIIIFGGSIVGRAAPGTPTAIPTVAGGFVPDDGAANAAGKSGRAPSLAFGRLTTNGALQPWLAFAENNQVVAATFDAGAWQRRGGSLNFQAANSAASPSLDFSGANRTAPWVAFVETIGGKQQILAAKFDGASWQRIGGGTPPTLNISAAQDADHPRLAGSGTLTSTDSVPWVSWDEATASGRRVFVKRLSGNAWQLVGAALNVSASAAGSHPHIAFAGAGNTQPWVVWQERRTGQPGQIFAAKTTGDGQGSWSLVGRQALCAGAACTLNFDASSDAATPRITTGTLPGEAAPAPWIVFAEQIDGVRQIFVARLHPTDKDRFVLVGNHNNLDTGSLNASTAQNASDPDIFFVGNVPHVSWTEQRDGVSRVFVSHLADARPGAERWDLGADEGINRSLVIAAAHPAIGSAGTTPFVAWQEGTATTDVFAAHRYPDGPAWGSNRPPFIRIISGTHRLASSLMLTPNLLTRPAQDDMLLGPAEFVTSCDHVNGWDNITDVQFKLSDASSTIFLGKYVASENKFYVEDPAHPGTFLPPSTPGSGEPIETANVILDVPQMSAFKPGAGSAVVDMTWVLYFKRPTFLKDYVQSIDIGYTTPSSARAGAQPPQQVIIERTGFFSVGTASVGQRVMLPLVKR
jgi:hypothetical protein